MMTTTSAAAAEVAAETIATTVMIMAVVMIMMTITMMKKKIMIMMMILIIHLPLVQRHGHSPNKHITNLREHIPKWKEVCSTSHTRREGTTSGSGRGQK